jgi:xanthine dehydrogenase YagR molybdenum-binding subunit
MPAPPDAADPTGPDTAGPDTARPDTAVGRPMSRVDGRLKVTGRATYAAEHPLPDLLHAVLVTSTVSRATITALDSAGAAAAPGVQRVLAHWPAATLPFAADEVSFFGQPIAVVVAAELEQAEHAASLVEVRYAEHPALTDLDAPTATRTPGEETPDYRRGDPDAALSTAPVRLDRSFTIAREHHNPMELPSTIARWDGDRLTLWDKTQWVQGTANSVAGALGVPVDHIRVICPFLGGAFGSAGLTWPHQILAAHAARELGRPVKLVLSRRQMYSAVGYRPASRQRLAVGAGTDGRLSALVHEAHHESSRYQPFEDGIIELPRVVYQAPHVRAQLRLVPLDVPAATFMRGPGAVTATFALESVMDELAHELRLDPIELRRRNEPAFDQVTGLPFTNRGLDQCFQLGAEAFGWSRRNATPRASREGELLIGLGMAAAVHHNNRTAASALARINADGTAVVASATADMGPGTYTAMTQIAADALGLPVGRVTFQLGDSTLPKAPMHSGSKTLASVGSAVFTACASLRDSVVRTAVVDPASPLHGATPDQVSVRGGLLSVTGSPERAETYQQILRRRGRDNMASQQSWAPGDVDKRLSTYAYGAVFAEVSVDERLGLVRVRRIFTAYDVGRVVSPKLAHSQALSGMVAGIGMALLENTVRDHRDGRVVNANLADYLVPVNADVPELDAAFVDGADPEADPIAVKGLGELVIVGVPAAIANAVFNATGRRVRDLPITLDRLL